MYTGLKHLHLTAVIISVLFLLTRYVWAMMDSQMLQKKWVKVVPHVVDTVLLAAAIGLCVILAQYPFVHGWVTEKVVGVILYIGLGFYALKKAPNNISRSVAMAAALAVLAVIGKTAVTKQPLFF